MTLAERPDVPFGGVSWQERKGMDVHLDSLQSVLIMLSQRHMDREQIERYACLLQAAEKDAIRRLRRVR